MAECHELGTKHSSSYGCHFSLYPFSCCFSFCLEGSFTSPSFLRKSLVLWPRLNDEFFPSPLLRPSFFPVPCEMQVIKRNKTKRCALMRVCSFSSRGAAGYQPILPDATDTSESPGETPKSSLDEAKTKSTAGSPLCSGGWAWTHFRGRDSPCQGANGKK